MNILLFKNTPIKEPVSICLHQTIVKNKLTKSLFQKLINHRVGSYKFK